MVANGNLQRRFPASVRRASERRDSRSESNAHAATIYGPVIMIAGGADLFEGGIEQAALGFPPETERAP